MLYILEGVSALSSFNKMNGCNKDAECPDSMRCVGRTCLNLCPSACGTNSVCRMTNHLPVCSCPPGYRGNPYAWVYNYERSRCDLTKDFAGSRFQVKCSACHQCVLSISRLRSSSLPDCHDYLILRPSYSCYIQYFSFWTP